MKPTSNGEPLISMLLQAKAAKLGVPIVGNFEITPRCNLACRMCYVRLSKEQVMERGGELSTETWKSYIADAIDQGMLLMLLTGGEPMLRPDFSDIYEFSHERGVLISINTNGTMLTKEHLDLFAKMPPLRINMSLYGASETTYGDLCGDGDAFNRVVSAIKMLRGIGIDVKLNHTVTPYNVCDMEAVHMLAKELEVPVQMASYMFPPARRGVNADSRLSAEESAKASLKIAKLGMTEEHYAMRLRQLANCEAGIGSNDECMELPVADDAENDVGEKVRCRAGVCNFWLAWDGNMLPCGIMPYPKVNIEEAGGFANAWRMVREYVRQMRMPAKCRDCALRSVCDVCVAGCICETGAANGVPEYMCRRIETMVQCAKHELNDREK